MKICVVLSTPFHITETKSFTLRDSFLVSLPPEADTSLSEPLYNFVSDCFKPEEKEEVAAILNNELLNIK